MKQYSKEYKRTKYTSRQRRRMWGYLRPKEIPIVDNALKNKPRDRVLFKLMYRCGLRVGEVVGEEYEYKVGPKKDIEAHSVLPGIMTDDIDFGGKAININGKGDLKRIVPIPDDVFGDVMYYLHDYRRWGNKNEQLIVRYKDDQPMTTANVRKIWTSLKNRMGLRKDIRVHDLRHTYAMEYLRAGGDPRDLMNLLGHSSLDITMMYVQRMEEESNVKARLIMKKMGENINDDTEKEFELSRGS